MKTQNFIKNCSSLLVATSVAFVITACGGGGGGGENTPAVSETNKTDSTTTNGKVVDAPIYGAKVCYDANNNDKCDANEVSTTTDKNGNFTITYNSVDSGKLIATGGIDTGTLKKFTGIYSAPNDSKVISPLTTLMVAGADENQIKTTYGIDNDVSLTETDPSNYQKATSTAAVYLKTLKAVSGKTDKEVATAVANSNDLTNTSINNVLLNLGVNNFTSNLTDIVKDTIDSVSVSSNDDLFDTQKAVEDFVVQKLESYKNGDISISSLTNDLSLSGIQEAIFNETANNNPEISIDNIDIVDKIEDENGVIFNNNTISFAVNYLLQNIEGIESNIIVNIKNNSNNLFSSVKLPIVFDSEDAFTVSDLPFDGSIIVKNSEAIVSFSNIPSGDYNITGHMEFIENSDFSYNVNLSDHIITKNIENNITINNNSNFTYIVHANDNVTGLEDLIVESSDTSIAEVTKISDEVFRISGVNPGVVTITAKSISNEGTVMVSDEIVVLPITVPDDSNVTVPDDSNVTVPDDSNVTVPDTTDIITYDSSLNKISITNVTNEKVFDLSSYGANKIFVEFRDVNNSNPYIPSIDVSTDGSTWVRGYTGNEETGVNTTFNTGFNPGSNENYYIRFQIKDTVSNTFTYWSVVKVK